MYLQSTYKTNHSNKLYVFFWTNSQQIIQDQDSSSVANSETISNRGIEIDSRETISF